MINRNLTTAVKYHLRDACDSLTVAFHKEGPAKNPHLRFARNSLAKALIPDLDVTPYMSGEEWLVDLIATAITDSTDIDCTSESQARYIVGELFKHLKPEASE